MRSLYLHSSLSHPLQLELPLLHSDQSRPVKAPFLQVAYDFSGILYQQRSRDTFLSPHVRMDRHQWSHCRGCDCIYVCRCMCRRGSIDICSQQRTLSSASSHSRLGFCCPGSCSMVHVFLTQGLYLQRCCPASCRLLHLGWMHGLNRHRVFLFCSIGCTANTVGVLGVVVGVAAAVVHCCLKEAST